MHLEDLTKSLGKKTALSGKYRLSWTEEVIITKDSETRSDNANYLGTSLRRKNGLIALIILILIFFCVLGRIFYLQIITGPQYRVMAESNRVRQAPIISERGIIFDKNGQQLVSNVPNFSLTLTPQDLPLDNDLEGKLARKKVIKKLISLTNIDESFVEGLLEKYGSYSYASLVLQEDIDYNTAMSVYLNSAQLPGISIQKGSKRKYISGSSAASSTLSASHLLGYLSKLTDEEYARLKNNGYLLFDNIGKTGLESQYETYLRGTYGKKKIEVDAGGHEKMVLEEQPPVAGNNLYLTLDIFAQAKLEEIIKKYLAKYNKKRAAAIALDPNTGAILAMVSWPAFDGNDFSGGISQQKYNQYLNNKDNPLFNRAADGTYPSGSTIKMVVGAGALQEGIINQNTYFLSTGGLAIDKWFFPDWQAGGHGQTNITKAIADSVNTFFYYIGGGYKDFVGLGVSRLNKYMKLFGLGQATGIDLPSEGSGLIPDKEWKKQTKNEDWYVGDTYNLSIGQGDLLVTPLQVAVWTAAFANGGKIITPHLADRTQNAQKHEVKTFSYSTQPTNIDASNIKIIKQGMGECVSYGSCYLLKNLPFFAGGKTGTAQWTTNNKQNHAWFTAFAPFDNPQIVITVLMEEGEEGATTAQPIARDFLEWWSHNNI
ncbi:MAG: penicillin-binding protein 2 [Candidatus Magasanikbacteria bacterium CG10_big_fil_rev_8_21_14_0_10_40_10]|uniref:Penicillin-binding protein 2 n=1 Tax=Candidatus Magasanikbacteria bacterium CG10_big_fil_rev_8_21_14_0_10_40_10 TaxID=1974648 RepID=A0A2M6W4Z5_9BACT|nr:MAG: penicillin-binding protein 2 [Candidatus Magasanikbacteria bacterium CG10_big_fil_rev_8_21_14_0_10_40_10]